MVTESPQRTPDGATRAHYFNCSLMLVLPGHTGRAGGGRPRTIMETSAEREVAAAAVERNGARGTKADAAAARQRQSRVRSAAMEQETHSRGHDVSSKKPLGRLRP